MSSHTHKHHHDPEKMKAIVNRLSKAIGDFGCTYAIASYIINNLIFHIQLLLQIQLFPSLIATYPLCQNRQCRIRFELNQKQHLQ